MKPALAWLVVAGLTALAPAASAQDRWTNIRRGVDYLRRTAPGPQEIFAARVDLRVPNISLHASADNAAERHVTTSTFARNVGALVAINADWSDTRTPVGVAISDGNLWHGHIPDSTLSGTWGYFGCTATGACAIGTARPLDVDWDMLTPTVRPHRFFQAIGNNGYALVQSGVAAPGCYDTARNPRSALGLSADGNTLWLVVVDGRRSTALGMTCDQTRALMIDLGCHSAGMLDGGGSSTLVVDGTVRNTPSDGSLRTVSNHLAVMYAASVDSRCTVPSGRWCTGATIATCQGGRYLGSGNCAAFGAGCEEDGAYAYCVDPRCPGGRGNASVCTDAQRIATCNDGQYSTGDCGAFGLGCGTDAMGARCMDRRCAARPSGATCTAAGLLATCTGGTYAERACAMGTRCAAAGATAQCAGPTPIDAGSPTMDVPPVMDAPTVMDRLAVVDVRVADAPAIDVPAIDVPAIDVPAATTDRPVVADAPADDEGARPAEDAAASDPALSTGAGCGCAVPSSSTGPRGALSLAALGALVSRRRRRRSQGRGRTPPLRLS